MTLYLILHKVKGEPAFDVANLCEEMGTPSDPGPWWIIPTSGHRAYPAGSWRIDCLLFSHESDSGVDREAYELQQDPRWDDLPDHYEYQFNTDKTTGPISQELSSVAAALLRPIAPVKRRF